MERAIIGVSCFRLPEGKNMRDALVNVATNSAGHNTGDDKATLGGQFRPERAPLERLTAGSPVGNYGTVAAIIPTYNRRDLVLQAVSSVMSQTYPDVACIVVDNGSTDGTAEAVAGLAGVTVVKLDEPCGAARARNAGIAAADGATWVAFLDNDDVWAPEKIERQLSAIAAHPEARWSATSCVDVGPDLRVRWAARLLPGSSRVPPLVSATDMVELLKGEQVVPAGGSSVLALRELVVAVGNFNVDVAGCEEWDLWVRLAKESPLAYVDEPLVAYRVWDGQTSTDVRQQVHSVGMMRQRNFPEMGPLPRSYLARWEQETARRHVSGRRRKEAARAYVRAARVGHNPGQVLYAIAAITSIDTTERRLQRIERGRCSPDGWEDTVEPWLKRLRGACTSSR